MSLLFSFLLWIPLFIINVSQSDDSINVQPIIDPETDALRVNVHFNVTNNINYSTASPNPDITILSNDYFLCLWSYIVRDDTSNITKYSNEIYSNLFSSTNGRSMVRTEYLLNKLVGYSQDTPSATALFNISNHITRQVAVVWESQIEYTSNRIIDAIYGRIIKWSITYSNGYRYVKVTSPTSQEFQISSTSLDFYHHKNPDVIPIYNTGKFLVSWISYSETAETQKNMVFIRIYYNSGTPYSEQIQIHSADLFWKKYPRTIPLLHNLTLISWLSQSVNNTNNNNLVIYGMIFDENGNNKLNNTDSGRYTFKSMNDNVNHTIFIDTIPVICHLHNDPYRNNNYFIVGWQSINNNDGSNTIYAAIYMYNDETNNIQQISIITSLFDNGYDPSLYKIEYPQMENIVNQLYELEDGLNAKVALCYSLKDLINDKSDIYCKIIEITLWDNGDNGVEGEINIITDDRMINSISSSNHQHEHPQISSESILRDQADYDENPQFVVVWSNSRKGGYDVYTRILKLNENGIIDNGDDDDDDDNNPQIFDENMNIIIIGVVFGIILVVLAICVCNHFYLKHKDLTLKPRSKMQQLGEESDDDDEHDDDDEDIIIGGYDHNETIGGNHDDDDDEDDGLQLTQQHSYN